MKKTLAEAPLVKITSKHKPRISFTEKDLPEIKGWGVGQKYQLVIEVQMTGVQKEVDYANSTIDRMASGEAKKIISATFEVEKLAVDSDYSQEYARHMANAKPNG